MVTPNPLLDIAGRALGAALDRVVALDPQGADRVRELEGRALDVTWAGPEFSARIEVRDGHIVFGPGASRLDGGKPADLGVRATLAGALNMLLRERGERGLPGLDAAATKVQISGDAELARTLSRVVERFEPDVERAFAGVLGEVAGVQLARALKRGLDWARESVSSLAQDAGAFVRDESRDAVARTEIDDFLADVDRLRDDAERVAARVARVQRGAAPAPARRAAKPSDGTKR
ncbi:MAG TPA: hypothetical protein VND91_00375 [Candidatus Saccharimonadia bacterium]|nr:hypothetical protein [Candidatus Saccharimonadia bacterium]